MRGGKRTSAGADEGVPGGVRGAARRTSGKSEGEKKVGPTKRYTYFRAYVAY